MNARPIGDRIIVLPDPVEKTTEAGIIIPETAVEKPQRGTVAAVGPGCQTVSKGDRVIYGKLSGASVVIDDQDVVIMKESELFAIL